MAEINNIQFLNKLIHATNTKDLSWVPLSSSKINLAPLARDKFDTGFSISGNLIANASYVASIAGGYVFLLYIDSDISILPNFISLRVQTIDSTLSKEYLTSNSNKAEEVILLKRLYNIVDLPVSEIDDIVNNFLK